MTDIFNAMFVRHVPHMEAGLLSHSPLAVLAAECVLGMAQGSLSEGKDLESSLLSISGRIHLRLLYGAL